MTDTPGNRERASVNPKLRRRSTLLMIAILAILLGGVVFLTFTQARFECKIWMKYKGGSEVRTAASATEEDSIRSAVSSACATLANGMAESISCSGTPPQRVECREL